MNGKKEYIKFDILEVANACGIQFHPRQKNPAERLALCPFCADSSYHLYINPVKERFHCQRCNASGNSVSLYARIHGISNAKAAAALKNNFEWQDDMDLCQYFGQKKLKYYADFFSSSSSLCCGGI